MTGSIAQDPNEGFDVVTSSGAPTGIVKARAAVHRDGGWHRSVHVWIAGADETGPFLTFQRRSTAKDTWGGKLDATVGGHVRAGETLVDTLREVEEEIGVAVGEAALRPLGVRVSVNDIGSEIRDHELQSVFLSLDDRPLLDYSPNPAELEALVRFQIDQLFEFFEGAIDRIQGASRAPGANQLATESFTRNDFIDNIDGYFYRIAIAAERALRGERHIAI